MAAKYHKITGNESIGSIAGIYGVNPQTLLKANPNMLSAVSGAFLKVPGATPPPPTPGFWQTIKNALTGNNPIVPGSTSMAGVGGSLAGVPIQGTAQDYARLNTTANPDQAARAAVRVGFGQAGAGMTANLPIASYGPTSYGLAGAPNPYAIPNRTTLTGGGLSPDKQTPAPLYSTNPPPIRPYPVGLQTYPLQNSPSIQPYPLGTIGNSSLSPDKQGVLGTASAAPVVTASSRAAGKSQFLRGEGIDPTSGYIPTRSDVWNMKANARRRKARGGRAGGGGGKGGGETPTAPVTENTQSNIGTAASVWRIG